jgi:branched-chain amino acid transport system permease protein
MYQIGSFNFSQTDIMIFAGTSVILAGLWFLLTRTKLGLAIRAAAQDIETSEIVGVNVRRSIAVVFFISSAIAAFGGVMVAILYDAVSPDMGNMIAYKGLALVVIGGFGSLPGAVVASLMLGLAETFATTYTSLPLSHEALAMLFLVALILIRPQGLMGKA